MIWPHLKAGASFPSHRGFRDPDFGFGAQITNSNSDCPLPAAGKTLGSAFEKRVEWLVMSKNQSKSASTRTLARIAVLTSVCCLAVGSLLPAQAQPTMDPSSANFQADAANLAMLIQTKAPERGVAIPHNEGFSLRRSFRMLEDHPRADKPSGRPNIRAGYGQFFAAQNLVRPSTSGPEAPSWLYLKVSFTF